MLNRRFCLKAPEIILGNMINAISRSFGSEGYDVLKEVLTKFGLKHGLHLRKRVEGMGLDTTLENFILFNGIYEPGCFHFSEEGDRIQLNCEFHNCPASEWSDKESLQKKKLFGELSRAILQGYNPELATGYSNIITLGSRSCDLVAQLQI